MSNNPNYQRLIFPIIEVRKIEHSIKYPMKTVSTDKKKID